MLAGLRDGSGTGDADAVEAERAGFLSECGFEVGACELDGLVQKSRST
jgi:hypothetical protein